MFDHTLINQYLFHPRRDSGVEKNNPKNVMIPVDDGIHIGSRFHLGDQGAPNLIFFHGNAELVSEYDMMANVYMKLGINFIPVDYRGYGFSDGSPSMPTLLNDAVVCLNFIRKMLNKKGYSGNMVVMGRSLGSAAVLQQVSVCPELVYGLIIESGFAYEEPLFRLLGLDPNALGFKPDNGLNHIEKIKNYTGPTFIIHARQDHIIAFNEGEDLFSASGGTIKEKFWVDSANHNNILHVAGHDYFMKVSEFIKSNCMNQD